MNAQPGRGNLDACQLRRPRALQPLRVMRLEGNLQPAVQANHHATNAAVVTRRHCRRAMGQACCAAGVGRLDTGLLFAEATAVNQQIPQRVVAAIPSTSAIPLGIQLELVGPQRVVPRALVQRCAIAMKDGGWDWEQTLEAGRRLEAAGASFLDKSSGGASYPQKVAAGPGYQIPFPAAIKRAVSIPVIGVGLITDPRQAETILVVE